MLHKEEFNILDKEIYPALFDISIDNGLSPILSENIYCYNANDKVINILFWNDKIKKLKIQTKIENNNLIPFIQYDELENLSEAEIAEYFIGKSDIHIELKQLNRSGDVISKTVYIEMIYMGVSEVDSYDDTLMPFNNIREGRRLLGITFFALDSLTKEKTNKLLML